MLAVSRARKEAAKAMLGSGSGTPSEKTHTHTSETLDANGYELEAQPGAVSVSDSPNGYYDQDKDLPTANSDSLDSQTKSSYPPEVTAKGVAKFVPPPPICVSSLGLRENDKERTW